MALLPIIQPKITAITAITAITVISEITEIAVITEDPMLLTTATYFCIGSLVCVLQQLFCKAITIVVYKPQDLDV